MEIIRRPIIPTKKRFEIASDAGQFLVGTALKVRQSFESGEAYSGESLIEEYGRRTDLEDAAKTIRILRHFFPKYNCRLASVAISRELDGDCSIVQGYYDNKHNPHTFPFADGFVVDITADQFAGGPTIYVGRLEPPWLVTTAG